MGCQGRLSDGGVFKSSDLYRGILSSSLNIPEPTSLPNSGDPLWDEDDYPEIPYVIVGDDAFQLATHMMKPYSLSRQLNDEQLVFNDRLSHFRRVSENTFGIFGSRFRVFLSRINIKNLSSINKFILAGIVLHNMLCEKSSASYTTSEYIDQEDPVSGHVTKGQWRNHVPGSFLESSMSWNPRS